MLSIASPNASRADHIHIQADKPNHRGRHNRLHRHVRHLHLLLLRLQSPKLRPGEIAILRSLSTVLRFHWSRLDDYHRFLLWVLSFPTLEYTQFLHQLYYAYPSALFVHWLEGVSSDEVDKI